MSGVLVAGSHDVLILRGVSVTWCGGDVVVVGEYPLHGHAAPEPTNGRMIPAVTLRVGKG